MIAKPVCHRTTACVLGATAETLELVRDLISAEMTVLGTYLEFTYEPLRTISSGTAYLASEPLGSWLRLGEVLLEVVGRDKSLC